MSLARMLDAAALAVLLVACSGEETPPPTQTGAPAVEPTERVFPTATPLPPEILDDGCPVTKPNGSTPPGEDPSRYYHGNGQIWTGLYDNGTVVFEPEGPGVREEDGSLSMKFWWWRGVEGRLEIEGRRIDADADALRASIPAGYGDKGFQASALIFPTPGCWEVTAQVGTATLTFVTRVVSFY
jgi:hypothetical protein